MKISKTSFAMLVLISFVGATSGSAAVTGAIRPEIVGGINYMTNNSQLGYTAGLDIGLEMGPSAEVTLGGEFLYRPFTTTVSNINYIHIPAIFRLHLGPALLAGGGIFYDLPVTSGAINNYGVTGALKLKPMGAPVFVEGRYNYGLTTAPFSNNSSEIQGLLGFVF